MLGDRACDGIRRCGLRGDVRPVPKPSTIFSHQSHGTAAPESLGDGRRHMPVTNVLSTAAVGALHPIGVTRRAKTAMD